MDLKYEKFNEILDIKYFLKDFKKYKIIYIPNPGNAGDSLIALGTLTVFSELGLVWEFGSCKSKYYNKLIFFGGGGNLVGMYMDCKNFMNMNKDCNKIIILPHTIKDEDELIRNLNYNVIIICREKKSYNYVKSLAKYDKNIYLSKDMALYIKNINKNIKGDGICNAFRTDSCEKTNIQLPENNIDLSFHFSMQNNCDKNIIPVSYNLFEYLSKFQIINTNRLHICIAGLLLGKKVNLFPNNYWKNREVYEYSLKNFNTINFVDYDNE